MKVISMFATAEMKADAISAEVLNSLDVRYEPLASARRDVRLVRRLDFAVGGLGRVRVIQSLGLRQLEQPFDTGGVRRNRPLRLDGRARQAVARRVALVFAGASGRPRTPCHRLSTRVNCYRLVRSSGTCYIYIYIYI